MARTTTFILGKHHEDFIRHQVESGEYATASEVIRDALRRLERKKRRDAAIVDALIEAESGGSVSMVDGDLVGDVRRELGL